MFDRLFAARGRLSTPDLMEYAEQTGLDVRRFAHHLGTADLARRVQVDLVSAEASGVTSIPTFFVNGRRHEGPHDAATLVVALGGPPAPRALPGDDAAEPSPGVGPDRPALPTLPADVPETPDHGGAYPRLTDGHIALLAAAGARRRIDPGDVLYRAGDPDYRFVAVLSGAVAIVDAPDPDADPVEGPRVSVHGQGRFLGGTDIWRGGSPSRSAVAVRAGEVLVVPADRRRQVLAANADLRETIVRAFLLRHGR